MIFIFYPSDRTSRLNMKVTSILVLLAVLLVSVKSEVVELNAEQLLEIAYGEGEDTWFIKLYCNSTVITLDDY